MQGSPAKRQSGNQTGAVWLRSPHAYPPHPTELNKDSSHDALSVKTRERACLLFCLLYTQCSNRNFKGEISRLWVLPQAVEPLFWLWLLLAWLLASEVHPSFAINFW